jgi:hypothetical protein
MPKSQQKGGRNSELEEASRIVENTYLSDQNPFADALKNLHNLKLTEM